MSIARLRADETVLLIIDVQERLLPSLIEADRLVSHCAFLGQVAGVMGLPTLVTEQYVKGLGRTSAAVLEAVPRATLVEKTRFSGYVPAVAAWLEASGRRSVLLCGAETHVCVLQTALDLLANGYQTFVISDAVTCGEADQHSRALERMSQAGAITTGCVSATYELLGDAASPRFRECLPLVKKLRAGP